MYKVCPLHSTNILWASSLNSQQDIRPLSLRCSQVRDYPILSRYCPCLLTRNTNHVFSLFRLLQQKTQTTGWVAFKNRYLFLTILESGSSGQSANMVRFLVRSLWLLLSLYGLSWHVRREREPGFPPIFIRKLIPSQGPNLMT